MKTSWRYLCKTSSRCLEDVLKTFLQDVLKSSWRHLGKTSWRSLENVLKTYSQDQYIGLDQSSSEDVSLGRTSWSRCLEDVFKTCSKDEDERRLQDFLIKTNVCWDIFMFSYIFILWAWSTIKHDINSPCL